MTQMNDRIAIIGGGLSGLVIADELRRKGYENITVFEKDSRVGGKLQTIWYKGKFYEMGAIFGLSSHHYLKGQMKRNHLKSDGPRLYRTNYDACGQKITPIPKEVIGDYLDELDRFPEVLKSYKSLNQVHIQDVEASLTLPFSKWCDFNGFKVLKMIYVQYFTIFGLGRIDEVPALYALRILNYENLMSFMGLPQFITWKEGTSSLIESLMKNTKDVRIGQQVLDISMKDDKTPLIHTEYEVHEFEQVIITAPLDQFVHCQVMTQAMIENLSAIRYQYFNVYGILANPLLKGCGCILENITPLRNGHMIMWNTQWDEKDGDGMMMVYAYNAPDNSLMTSLDLIKEDLSKLGVDNPRLYQAKRWKHCPYVGQEALENGFYNTMETHQGHNHVYFSGEIMSTLSMDNCIRYAEDLVQRFF